jgi:hypothetical protein
VTDVLADTQILPELRGRYLELLKRSLTGSVHGDVYAIGPQPTRAHRVAWSLLRRLTPTSLVVARRCAHEELEAGRVWPLTGETMIGIERLSSLQECIEDVLADEVPGDLIEAGVWRGGATILMRAVLEAYGAADRQVYVADSFEGIPREDADRYPADRGARFDRLTEVCVPEDAVRANFARYGLLDERVHFVRGRFRDSLPGLHGHPWAVIRLDGDLYESTWDGLENLYPSLAVGGYVIVDDAGDLAGSRQAIDDFRAANDITEPIRRIDWTGVCWRREA